MEWMAGQDSLFAYGRASGYLVTREETGVRLARFSIARVAADMTVAAIADAVRSTIIFPLGRGPGRPSGTPELTALMESAKTFADQYEAGGDLAGYPAWQHGPRLRVGPGETVRFTGDPPAVDYLHDPYAGHGPRRYTGIDEDPR